MADREERRQSPSEIGRERPIRRREKDQGSSPGWKTCSAGLDVDGDDGATARFRGSRGGEELVVEVQQLPGLAVDVEDGEDEAAVQLVLLAWPEELRRLLSTATPSTENHPQSRRIQRGEGEGKRGGGGEERRGLGLGFWGGLGVL